MLMIAQVAAGSDRPHCRKAFLTAGEKTGLTAEETEEHRGRATSAVKMVNLIVRQHDFCNSAVNFLLSLLCQRSRLAGPRQCTMHPDAV